MSDTLVQSDTLRRFLFENAQIRGEWVHLTESWQAVLQRRAYPKAIRRILGQMMSAAALLAETVKMQGRLVLQIRSEGPANLLMVECTSKHTLRAFAQWNGDIADDEAFLSVTGTGALAITIEVEGAKQPYQGIVSLQGESIADTLETYFEQSEQLATKIWLSADDSAVAGLFLQQLPSEQQHKHSHDEDWNRVCHLASTVTEPELVSLTVENLLHRLFHEEEVRLFEGKPMSFACTCSRKRVGETIVMLGREEADLALNENEKIEVACEFCNEHYYFDKVDVAELFTDSIAASSENNILH